MPTNPRVTSPVAALLVAFASLGSLACGPRQSSSANSVRLTCTATRELLKDGGFESGSLDDFEIYWGQPKVVESVGSAATCHEPGATTTPHRGRYVFSAAADDGARPKRSSIDMRQVLQIKDLGLSPGDYVAGSAFVAGSCDESSDSGSTVSIFFMRGGPEGKELDQATTWPVDPSQGQWQQLITPPTLVPAEADTIVFDYRSSASYDKPRVELWSDDLSLAVCGSGEELEAWRPLESSSLAAAAPPVDTSTAVPPVDTSTAAVPPQAPPAAPTSTVRIAAERPECVEETPDGVVLKGEACSHQLDAPTPTGDYELAYTVRHWNGQYGLWLGKPGAGEPATRIGLDLDAAVTITRPGLTLSIERQFGLPVSAHVRLVRAGDRLLFYANEELVFAKPVARDEGNLGFWHHGGAPRVSALSLRALTTEEMTSYRATPDTPSEASLAEEKQREAAAKEPTFRWSSRLTFELGDNHGAKLERNEAFRRNGFELFEPRLEVARMRRLAGPFYAVYGVNAGYFSAVSSTCTGPIVCASPEECECTQGGAHWSTRGLSYGATAALALPGLDSTRQGVIIWLPILRANHLISTPAKVECNATHGCPEKGWSVASARLEASAGIDWIYKGLGGCGPRVTFGYYFGDVAERQDLGLVLSYGLSFHVETLEL